MLRDFDPGIDGVTNGHEQPEKECVAHKRLAKKIQSCCNHQKQNQNRAINVAGTLASCRYIPIGDQTLSFSEKQEYTHNSKATEDGCQSRPCFFKRKLANRQHGQNHRQQQKGVADGGKDGGGGFCHGGFVNGVR